MVALSRCQTYGVGLTYTVYLHRKWIASTTTRTQEPAMTDLDHSHPSAPHPSPAGVIPTTMRAAVHERYGPPEDVVSVRAVPVPDLGPDDVLVRVGEASVNALDWHYVTGLPMFARPTLGLRRPKRQVPGADVAGVVEAVGAAVTRLRVGDRVFGQVEGGAFAEFVVAPADWLVPVPDG